MGVENLAARPRYPGDQAESPDPLARRVLGRNLTRVAGQMRRRIRRQQARGQVRQDLDPGVLSLALTGIALLYGVMPALQKGDKQADKQGGRRGSRAGGRAHDPTANHQILSVLLDGIRPRP